MATFRQSLQTTIEAARPDLTYCVPGAVRTGSLPAFYTRFGGYGERFTAQWELIVLVQVYEKKDAYDTVGKLADDVYEALYDTDYALPTALDCLPRIPARSRGRGESQRRAAVRRLHGGV